MTRVPPPFISFLRPCFAFVLGLGMILAAPPPPAFAVKPKSQATQTFCDDELTPENLHALNHVLGRYQAVSLSSQAPNAVESVEQLQNFLGVSPETIEILKRLDLAETTEISNFSWRWNWLTEKDLKKVEIVTFRAKKSMSLIELVKLLNGEAARTLKAYAQAHPESGLGDMKPQELVLYFNDVGPGAEYKDLFYSVETSTFHNSDGEILPKRKIGMLGEPKDSVMASDVYLKVAASGFTTLDPRTLLVHDTVGHFFDFIRHPEITLSYRTILSHLSTDPHWKHHSVHESESALYIRAHLLDELNFYAFKKAAASMITEIGKLKVPKVHLNTRGFRNFLMDAYDTDLLSARELREFTEGLFKRRHEIFDRFGGGTNDGYNDANPLFGLDAFLNTNPLSELQLAKDSAQGIDSLTLEGQEQVQRKKVETVIKHLSHFLSAVRNQVPLKTLLEDALYIPKEAQERYRNSETYRFFSQVYGEDDPKKSAHRAIFVDLKESY